MTEKEKTSDAVRITRIVAPTILIISLALIFKSEFRNVVNRGCFDLQLEQAGLGLSDKSLCTKEDFEETADTLVAASTRKAAETAQKSFAQYESMIAQLEKDITELNTILAQRTEMIEVSANNQSRYKNVLERTIANSSTYEARTLATRLDEQFTAIYGGDVAPQQMQPIKTIDPKVVAEKKATIRADYNNTSRTEVNRIQQNIKVEQQKK